MYSVKFDSNNQAVSLYSADFVPEGFEACTAEEYLSYKQDFESRVPDLPNKIKREQAYETRRCITWEGVSITVDKANDLWTKYQAEGSDTAATLSDLIATAKAAIREEFPDDE